MEENRKRLVRELREEAEKAQAFATWAGLQAYSGGAAIRSATRALKAYTEALASEPEDAELQAATAAVKALIEDPNSVLNQLHALERRFDAEVAPTIRRMNVAAVKLAQRVSGATATLGALEDMASAARLATGAGDTGRHRGRSTRGKKSAEQPVGRGQQPKMMSLFESDE